jgi:hypothetical protein
MSQPFKVACLVLASILALTGLLPGCASRVVIGGGAESPDKAIYLSVDVATAPGVPYDERGEKLVRISISERGAGNRSLLLQKDLKFDAAQLDWDIKWQSPDRVNVDLFEYPPGISMHSDSARNKTAPRVAVTSLSFARSGKDAPFKPVE